MRIDQALSWHAQWNSKRLAIIDGTKQVTYQNLNDRVNALANALLAHGIHTGDKVSILLYNSLEFLECYFALSRIGACAIPINFRLIGNELAYVMNDSQSKGLIYGSEFVGEIEKCMDQLQTVQLFICVGESEEAVHVKHEELIQKSSVKEIPEFNVHIEDIQMIMYTSGTTGKPKGAMLSHSNIYWNILNVRSYHHYQCGDRCLIVLPLYHTAALHFQAIPMLHSGATLIIHRRYNLDHIMRDVECHGITSTMLLPEMWRELANLKPWLEQKSQFKELVTGGGPTPPETVEYLQRAYRAPYSLIMGMTEVGPHYAYLPPEWAVSRNGSIGYPTMHYEIRIIDHEMRDVPPGEVGEMLIRGPTVMKGYFNNPATTRQTFTDGWFHTGDLVTQEQDGLITIADRKKDMIRSGGENIYCLEVERTLLHHPNVLEAAIIGVPDDKYGEAVKAFVVVKPDQNLTAEELIDFCKNNMASYKKPRIIEFVDDLPRNKTGKINKQQLREQRGGNFSGSRS